MLADFTPADFPRPLPYIFWILPLQKQCNKLIHGINTGEVKPQVKSIITARMETHFNLCLSPGGTE